MISRRTAVKGVIGAGAVAAGAAGWKWGLGAPPPSLDGADVRTLMRRVSEGLSGDARARAIVPFDDPMRHYFNRGLFAGGVVVSPLSLTWSARRDLAALAQRSLSEVGHERILGQGMPSMSGVNYTQLLFCGDPQGAAPCQAMLSAVHLNLRLGGTSPEGSAFGGPQVYGDQRGNNRDGLPGNVFRYQMEHAHRLHAALTSAERAKVRSPRAPAQVNVGLQGRNGRFDGIAVGDLPLPRRALARAVVDSIFSTYAEQDAAYAWQCLERNGGMDALHFADYEIDFDELDRRFTGVPSQIFRLEGPAAVMHFRGYPHLHAFLNVARDAEAPRGGEILAMNPRRLEGEDLQAWFEDRMRSRTEADAGVYPSRSVVGRLREGPVYAGDIWVAESWANDLVAVDVRGDALTPTLSEALLRRGTKPQSDRSYRLAMPDFVANHEMAAHSLRVTSRRSLGPLREALVEEVRRRGMG